MMLRRVVATGFVWVAMVTFGAVLVETLLIYPNVFPDVPGSLDGAMAFFTVTGPADVFPPLGRPPGWPAPQRSRCGGRNRAAGGRTGPTV
ncbi:hypothetical protein [Pseudonocardia sp.]|uniref:hypothetical protein n=1 Tax=Pseudonocardia sp. TaxID=60912 RepID=UPI0031FC477D